MLSSSAHLSLSRTLNILMRSICTSEALAVRSPGPREMVPSNIKRSPGRFSWSVRARWVAPTLQEIVKRKEKVRTDHILRYGEEKVTRRSQFNDWNYTSELFAFQARIGESFEDSKLREAFITPDYLSAEQERRAFLAVDSSEGSKMWGTDNSRLARTGYQIVAQTLAGYVQLCLPKLPPDGVEAIVKHLMSEDHLAHVSFHIGTKDLILSEEYPPSVSNIAQVFLALVAALNESSGADRAVRLVLDLVATQLHGLDISDAWNLQNPMGYLVQTLKSLGKAEPESRLLWTSGPETILSTYHIGIYSDRELVGQASGETVEIAEEMAALDALRRIFQFSDNSNNFPMGKKLEKMIDKIIASHSTAKMLSI